jgi:hypothetical protein
MDLIYGGELLARRHWPGTTGASDVKTTSMVELALAIEFAIVNAGIIAVDGLLGVGKSFAIKAILTRLGIRWWYLPMGPDPTGKAFEVDLLQAVYDREGKGRKVDRSRHRGDLRNDLRDAFSMPGVFVIDDFTKSGLVGVGVIRWLFEQPSNRVAFILLGNDLATLLRGDPAFYSRVLRVVPFGPMSDDELISTIGDYHALFAGADTDASLKALLLRINREHTLGSFRAWAIFLAHVLELQASLGGSSLTEERADRAIAQINKRLPR